MKKSSLVILISILCAFAIFTFLTLRNNKKELNEQVYRADSTQAVFITWEKVERKMINPSFTFSGSFEPNKEVQILPERSGKVTEVGIELGDFVTKGKLIAHLDNDELQLQLANNQTQYEDALRTFERNKVLASGEAVSKTAFEKSELALKGLQNAIDVLKKQMTYMNMYAPMSGYITSKNFELGSIVSPGMMIAMVTDIGFVKLNILVPENSIAQFKKGSTLAVSCDAYSGSQFTGVIDYIAVKADDSKNFLVKVKVANTSSNLIRAGMFGKAYFKSTQTSNTLAVSRTAIAGSTKNPQVYIIKNNVAMLTNVTLGQILEDQVEVVKGLSEGDLVANSGLVNLADGLKVAQVSKEVQASK
jgi:RND family efflux transporter MFP subunit